MVDHAVLESDGGDQFFCGGGRSGKYGRSAGPSGAQRHAAPRYPSTLGASKSKRSEFRNLDPALPEALVIFLAGVLHHFPVGPQGEGPRGLPRLREGLGIVDDHFMRDVTEVGPREALNEVQLIAVRMTDRIQTGLAVEIDGVDDQRVAFPMTHGIAEPGGDALAMRTAVDRDDGEPRVLFEQEREVRVALHDLHRLRRVDGARHAEREAGASVVAVPPRRTSSSRPRPMA